MKKNVTLENIFLGIMSFLAAVLIPLIILASGVWSITCYNISKSQEGLVSLAIMLATIIAYVKIDLPR